MGPALGSATLTFLLWCGLVVGGFGFMGFSFGWVLRHLLPPNQNRLPRRLWVAWCVVGALVLGLLEGVHVGVGEGALAFGDALVAGHVVVVSPLPAPGPDGRRASAGATLRHLGTAIDTQTRDFVHTGAIRYVIGHVTLGPFYGPTVGAITIARVYATDDRGGLGDAWRRARPELTDLAMENLAGSVLVGACYLLLLVLLGLLLVLAAWRDVRHPSAVAPAPEGAGPPA